MRDSTAIHNYTLFSVVSITLKPFDRLFVEISVSAVWSRIPWSTVSKGLRQMLKYSKLKFIISDSCIVISQSCMFLVNNRISSFKKRNHFRNFHTFGGHLHFLQTIPDLCFWFCNIGVNVFRQRCTYSTRPAAKLLWSITFNTLRTFEEANRKTATWK